MRSESSLMQLTGSVYAPRLPIAVQFHCHTNLLRTACSPELPKWSLHSPMYDGLDLIRLAVTDSANQERGSLTLLVWPV